MVEFSSERELLFLVNWLLFVLGREHPISFWVNWVLTLPGYPQLRTCKNNCVFSYFLRHIFFSVIAPFLIA